MSESLLPAELVFEILLRLPVKSLLRLRCVCRGWRDLIDSRNFTKSHFDYLSSRPPSLLILRRDLCDDAYNTYDVVELSSVIHRDPAFAFKELPFRANGESLHFVGQCNGLVCISHYSGAFLWNPATGEQFAFGLPPQRLRYREWWYDDDDYNNGSNEYSFRNWGFGYDKDSDDYIVVAVRDEAEAEGSEGWYFEWVYSLRSRSWQRIADFPYSFMDRAESGVFVNGALHWKVYHPETAVPVNVIGALHVGMLEYNLVSLPDSTSEIIDFMYLGVHDGCLCAGYYVGDDFDLWIMNEYGVRESWTKLIRYGNYTWGLVSYAYLRDDEVLLFTPDFGESSEFEMEIISRGGHEIKTRSFERMFGRYYAYVYVPSLVRNVW